MATLSTLRAAVTTRLGTAVTSRLTDDKKTEALNRAGKKLIARYPIDDILTTTSVVFTNGSATLPATYKFHHKEKLYDERSNEGYTHVDLQRFDKGEAKAWTVDTDGTMKITGGESVTLTFRHAQTFTEMSDDSDDSGLPSEIDDLHSLYAAELVAFDAQLYDLYQSLKQERMNEQKFAITDLRRKQGAARENGFDRIFNSSFGNRPHKTYA